MRAWMPAAIVALTLALAVSLGRAQQPAPPSPQRLQIVIVVDGLRPDFVTEAWMPRLRRLATRGTRFTNHHSVFPTVTRVNASTFTTGTMPARHGILGNAIYLPRVEPLRALDTANQTEMMRAADVEGRLVTAPPLGDVLAPASRKVLVVSSGSPGSAFLLAPTATSGTILNTDFFRPSSIGVRVVATLGAVPEDETPNDARNRYVTDMLLRVGLPEVQPDVVFVWFSEPDTTAHAKGIYTDETRHVLAAVDTEIGRIEDGLAAAGRLDTTNLLVVSDHGFSTHSGGFNLPALVKPFIRPMPDGSPDLVTAGGAVHFRSGRDPARVATIAKALQADPAVGAIFTQAKAPGDYEGEAPGTLSFDLVGWAHPRAGDLLVSANWKDALQGAPQGASTMAGGAAGHGSTNPDEVHNTLIAFGPDFARERRVQTPTGNVDIAPTLLHLAGVPVPATMDGRVLAEGLRTTNSRDTRVRVRSVHVETGDGRYRATANVSDFGGKSYFDFARVTRK